MRAGLIVHLVALMIALTAAYASWQSPETGKRKAGEVTLAEGDLKSLTRVAFKSEKSAVVITPFDDGGDQGWSVTLQREVSIRETPKDKASKDKASKKGETTSKSEKAAASQPAEVPRADGGLADGGEAEPAKVSQTFIFPAGRSVTRSLSKLAPFVVKRTIKDVPSERLAAMGFGENEASLEVTIGGKTLAFAVGGKTYGGSGRYLRDASGAVHLIVAAALRGLEGTETRLSERRLLPLNVEDITEVVVQIGDRAQSFVHQEREQAKKRYFARKEALSEKSEEAGAIVADFRRLRSKAYLLPEEIDLVDRELQASFTLRRHEAGEIKGKVYAAKDGKALIQVGRWSALVAEGMAKSLVDDIAAALP